MTVPVGEPAAGATTVTCAVKVTAWPNTDGSFDEITTVLVLAFATVSVAAARCSRGGVPDVVETVKCVAAPAPTAMTFDVPVVDAAERVGGRDAEGS